MGHLAKADGRVSEQEIGQAEAIMNRMQLNDEQRRRAQEAFRQGKDDDFPLDRTVAEFRQRIRRRRHLVVVFLELLLQTALADGELHAEEERILYRPPPAGRRYRPADSQYVLFQALLGGVGAAARRRRAAVAGRGTGAGVTGSFRSGVRIHRRLMSEHHPESAARGVDEMIRVVTEKTAEISKAYDMIKEARGMLSRHREDDKYPAAVA